MKNLQNGKWLVGVSGGCDSMALLHMCMEHQLDIIVAHVNYKVRKEADNEEAHVRSFCASYNIPIVVKNDVFAWSHNFEASARQYRYDFFKELIEQYHLDGVLIAHQQDDLLETYYMQKTKHIIPTYYGLQEETFLKGIRVIRPLLNLSRKNLEQYCKEHSVPYDIDSSNLSDDYERNQIRHHIISQYDEEKRKEILDEIKEKNHQLLDIRNQSKQLFHQDTINYTQYTQQTEEIRLTALRMLVEDKMAKQPSLEHLKEIDSIIMSKKDFVIACGPFAIARDNDTIFCKKEIDEYHDVYTDIKEKKKECYALTNSGPSTCAVTVKMEDLPITIRNVKEGDTIKMRFGTKSVHRFFIDRHIPLYLRPHWPVVINKNDEIILVPGLGCNINHYSTKPNLYVVQCLTMEDCLYVGREGHQKDSSQ